MTEREQQNEHNQGRFRQAKQQQHQRAAQDNVEFADEPGAMDEQQQQQQQLRNQRRQQRGAFNQNSRHPNG